MRTAPARAVPLPVLLRYRSGWLPHGTPYRVRPGCLRHAPHRLRYASGMGTAPGVVATDTGTAPVPRADADGSAIGTGTAPATATAPATDTDTAPVAGIGSARVTTTAPAIGLAASADTAPVSSLGTAPVIAITELSAQADTANGYRMQPGGTPDGALRYDKQGRRLCTAHKKRTHELCAAPAMNGATVCRMHGGNTPQVRAAARDRLLSLTGAAISTLDREMNGAAKAADRLRAAENILDRAGYPRTAQSDAESARAILVERIIALRG